MSEPTILGLNAYQIEILRNEYLINNGELPPPEPPPPKCYHERSISKLIDNGNECMSVCIRCGVKMIARWEPKP